MHQKKVVALASLVGLLLVAAPSAGVTVLRLDLEQLVARSGKILRGTVLEISTGTIEAGGGTLPTVTYVLRVEEAFKGLDKAGEEGTIEKVTMVGHFKGSSHRVGSAQRFSALPDVPHLEIGNDYLLFATPASALGLSTAVGLDQGAFRIFLLNRQEVALNGVDNANLGTTAGPVPYDELAASVRSLIGN